MPRILLLNLNHSKQAQDHLMQLMIEHNAGLAAVSEPHHIPLNSGWVHAAEDALRAAILWRKRKGRFSPISTLENGRFYCTVKWNGFVIVSIYVSPRDSSAEFTALLNELSVLTNKYKRFPILFLGDFNARHPDWDNGARNPRGRILKDWILDSNLFILNNNFVPTCVRQQGNSVVDLALGNNMAVASVTECTVRREVERTLSDHKLIYVNIKESISRKLFIQINNAFPK